MWEVENFTLEKKTQGCILWDMFGLLRWGLELFNCCFIICSGRCSIELQSVGNIVINEGDDTTITKTATIMVAMKSEVRYHVVIISILLQ